MPLPTIGQFFIASSSEAARLIDEQVAKVATDTVGLRSLDEDACLTLCVLPGLVLAAVDQSLAATTHDPRSWLAGMRLEARTSTVRRPKQSGYGRERGTDALLEYARTKDTMIDVSGTPAPRSALAPDARLSQRPDG